MLNAEQERLFNQHAKKAAGLGRKIAWRCGLLKIDAGILRNAALMGLCQAIQRFDATRGCDFWSFAFTRIRSEVLDECRRNDAVSRFFRLEIKRGRLQEIQFASIDDSDAKKRFFATEENEPPSITWDEIERATPELYRPIILGHFRDGRTLDSIAKSMRLSASRISQLKHEAFEILREKLGTTF